MKDLNTLRAILAHHSGCKTECSLKGEVEHWLRARASEEEKGPGAERGKPRLDDLVVMAPEDVQRPHTVVDGRNGNVIERIENPVVGDAFELALDIAVDAAHVRDSIKTEQALGHLTDYTDEFGKRYRELDVKLRKAGYR